MCNTFNHLQDKLHPIIDIDAIIAEKDVLLQQVSENTIVLDHNHNKRVTIDSHQYTVHKPSWNGELTQNSGTNPVDKSDKFKCGR